MHVCYMFKTDWFIVYTATALHLMYCEERNFLRHDDLQSDLKRNSQ